MTVISTPKADKRFKTPPSVAMAAVMEDARRAGLLDGEKTEHLSFRAPKALVDAAKRESGATGTTQLGLLALAALAQSDPVSAYMKAHYGALGPDHQLDF